MQKFFKTFIFKNIINQNFFEFLFVIWNRNFFIELTFREFFESVNRQFKYNINIKFDEISNHETFQNYQRQLYITKINDLFINRNSLAACLNDFLKNDSFVIFKNKNKFLDNLLKKESININQNNSKLLEYIEEFQEILVVYELENNLSRNYLQIFEKFKINLLKNKSNISQTEQFNDIIKEFLFQRMIIDSQFIFDLKLHQKYIENPNETLESCIELAINDIKSIEFSQDYTFDMEFRKIFEEILKNLFFDLKIVFQKENFSLDFDKFFIEDIDKAYTDINLLRFGHFLDKYKKMYKKHSFHRRYYNIKI